jgi:hypothetical protein
MLLISLGNYQITWDAIQHVIRVILITLIHRYDLVRHQTQSA